MDKDPRQVLGLGLTFDSSEVNLIADGFRKLILELQISARVLLRSIHFSSTYDQWATEFSHPPSYYEYQYERVELIPSVVDYFSGRSVAVPKGFVPYAEYSLGEKGARFVTLSFDFHDDHVRFFASGNKHVSMDGMTEFLTAAGLNAYIDEGSIVSR